MAGTDAEFGVLTLARAPIGRHSEARTALGREATFEPGYVRRVALASVGSRGGGRCRSTDGECDQPASTALDASGGACASYAATQDRGGMRMTGTWIDIAEGFRGYLAVPRCGSGPGMLLLQEIFGVNPHMRDVADYYAEEGYVGARARPVLAAGAGRRAGPQRGRHGARLRAVPTFRHRTWRRRTSAPRSPACGRGRNAPAR